MKRFQAHFFPYSLIRERVEIEKPAPKGEEISEEFISRYLARVLRGSGFWAESLVNVNALARREIPAEKQRDPRYLLEKYSHPLQPDIDVLYGPILASKKMTPLIGIEVKIFPESVGPGKVIPKTRRYIPLEVNIKGVLRRYKSGELTDAQAEELLTSRPATGTGFYTGMDEAMAMLLFGVDYVYLWHWIIVSFEVWGPYLEKYGEKFFHKLIRDHYEFARAYTEIAGTLFDVTALPVGYVCTGLLLDPSGITLAPCAESGWRLAPPNPLRDKQAPTKIRELLKRSYGVQED